MNNYFDFRAVYLANYPYCDLSIADLEAIDREFPTTEADIEFMKALTEGEYLVSREDILDPMRIVQISHSIFRLQMLHHCMKDKVTLLEYLTAKNITIWQMLKDNNTRCECISETMLTILKNFSAIVETIADHNYDHNPQGIHSQLHLFEDTSRELWKNYASFTKCFRLLNSSIKNIDLKNISELQDELVASEHCLTTIIPLIKIRSLLRHQVSQLVHSIQSVPLV